MEFKIEKIKIKNPDSHYGDPFGVIEDKEEIEIDAIRISEKEIIWKTFYPTGEIKFSHQYLDETTGLFKPCNKCGDKIKVTSGPVVNPEHIQKYCSMYGKY